ncbi:MAG TPA: PspA/IM30 family protein [Solirubrobacteraceae bacterium]|jgi:phage shock protein A
MSGLRGRFSSLVKAKTSAALDRAEDPSQTLDYSYEKQLEMMAGVKNGITEVATSRKRLQNQQDTLRRQVVKLGEQARQAVAAGKEDLARAALERKQTVQGEIDSLDGQVAELERQREQLTDSQHKLQAKLDAFRTQKEVVKAQYSAAQAQVQMSEASTGVGGQMADVGQAAQRAIEKTEDMKARAGAMDELEQAGTFGDAMQLGEGDEVDRQLAALGDGGGVDAELAEMKAQLATSKAPEQLPGPDTPPADERPDDESPHGESPPDGSPPDEPPPTAAR